MIKLLAVSFLVLTLAGMTGCSEIQGPSAKEIMSHPFGADVPFARGASKAEVLGTWGSPDQVLPLGVDELGNTREEWIYVGRLPVVPVDYGYVSKTKRLFFEGENLTRWETEELPGPSSPPAE